MSTVSCKTIRVPTPYNSALLLFPLPRDPFLYIAPYSQDDVLYWLGHEQWHILSVAGWFQCYQDSYKSHLVAQRFNYRPKRSGIVRLIIFLARFMLCLLSFHYYHSDQLSCLLRDKLAEKILDIHLLQFANKSIPHPVPL